VPAKGRNLVLVRVKNPSSNVVLMAFLTLRNRADGARVLPAYASKNYLNLLPGETIDLAIEGPSIFPNSALSLTVEGWNVLPGSVDVR